LLLQILKNKSSKNQDKTLGLKIKSSFSIHLKRYPITSFSRGKSTIQSAKDAQREIQFRRNESQSKSSDSTIPWSYK
jgi:hypothetical protein